MPFLLLEIQKALKPEYINWWYLKLILANNICTVSILSLANIYICLSLKHWPKHFKKLFSVIIPKLGKPAYDISKAFRPIILLNMFGKLIEKIIVR